MMLGSVSASPISDDAARLGALLHNESLVSRFSREGAPYAAMVVLDEDASTATGIDGPLARTEDSSHERNVGAAEITTRRRRPLDLVVPLLKQLTGIEDSYSKQQPANAGGPNPTSTAWRAGCRAEHPADTHHLQMEAVDAVRSAWHHSRPLRGWIPLEQLRIECGVSRDGSKASNIIRAARRHGLTAKGYSVEPPALAEMAMPCIIPGTQPFRGPGRNDKKRAYINDPASGRRRIDLVETTSPSPAWSWC